MGILSSVLDIFNLKCIFYINRKFDLDIRQLHVSWEFGEVQVEDINIEADTIQMVFKAKKLDEIVWDRDAEGNLEASGPQISSGGGTTFRSKGHEEVTETRCPVRRKETEWE